MDLGIKWKYNNIISNNFRKNQCFMAQTVEFFDKMQVF